LSVPTEIETTLKSIALFHTLGLVVCPKASSYYSKQERAIQVIKAMQPKKSQTIPNDPNQALWKEIGDEVAAQL
jgi:hypothetical protein